MRKKFIALMMSLVLVMGITGCESTKESTKSEPLSRLELFMGTAIKVTLYNGGSEETLDKVFDRILEIENLVSINKDNTELVDLNKNSGIKPVKLVKLAMRLLKRVYTTQKYLKVDMI